MVSRFRRGRNWNTAVYTTRAEVGDQRLNYIYIYVVCCTSRWRGPDGRLKRPAWLYPVQGGQTCHESGLQRLSQRS